MDKFRSFEVIIDTFLIQRFFLFLNFIINKNQSPTGMLKKRGLTHAQVRDKFYQINT